MPVKSKVERGFRPIDFESCFSVLDIWLRGSHIDPEKFGQDRFAQDLYNTVIARDIRNLWGLERGNSALYGYLRALGLSDPEDLTKAIFIGYWRRCNGQPVDGKQIARKVRGLNEHLGRFISNMKDDALTKYFKLGDNE